MLDTNQVLVPKKDRARMAQWLFFALVFYAVAAYVAMTGITEIRTVGSVAQKLGNVTLSSFVGYWIHRSAYKIRLQKDSPWHMHLSRAIIIGACILAVSSGF